jgi:hypothetical protein
MNTMSISSMRNYLSTSLASGKKGTGEINRNKLNGLLAEIEFRKYLSNCGFGDRVSVGGWIARSVGNNMFGQNTVVLFPHTLSPNELIVSPESISPSFGLHTICSTFHQIGIHSYFCIPMVSKQNDPASISWFAVQLGLPTQQEYKQFPSCLSHYFSPRKKRYNFLSNNSDASAIIDAYIPEEFSKEHLRVSFQNNFMSEISDVDGILWGQQHTYPIEIKEKTVADEDPRMGHWFGIDIGPFVKLAFYAAKRGMLHSLFVVHEIDDPIQRNHVNWWYITFEKMAKYASWNTSSGGTPMSGIGNSAVVKIPKSEFSELTVEELKKL